MTGSKRDAFVLTVLRYSHNGENRGSRSWCPWRGPSALPLVLEAAQDALGTPSRYDVVARVTVERVAPCRKRTTILDITTAAYYRRKWALVDLALRTVVKARRKK